MKKILILFLTLSLFGIFAGNANAITSDTKISKEVKSFVKNMSDSAIGIASDNSIPISKRRGKLIELFNDTVDLNWVTKFIMGKYYRIANNEQRTKFLTLYREYLIKVYAPKFNGYNGREFNILSITSEYEDEYIVKSEYIGEDNKEIYVDFLVVYSKDKSKFYVNDFIAEGVSFIVSQRSEINSAISNKGLDAFLEELQIRIDNLDKTNGEITKSIKSHS